ncbi:hypothetical protein [Tsukamurella soli]|uniref:Uncharacterized protein n=1 Tax=Tsukamurella soli TaxID=644556 RepID=A0ABP8JDV8_9ACTN
MTAQVWVTLVAAAGVALIAAVTLTQKHRADNRRERWARFQWAIAATHSDRPLEQIDGWTVALDLTRSPLATSSESMLVRYVATGGQPCILDSRADRRQTMTTSQQTTADTHAMTIRRMAARVSIEATRRLKEPVPQQLLDFADGKTDDPGPLPTGTSSRWRGLLVRCGLRR